MYLILFDQWIEIMLSYNIDLRLYSKQILYEPPGGRVVITLKVVEIVQGTSFSQQGSLQAACP